MSSLEAIVPSSQHTPPPTRLSLSSFTIEQLDTFRSPLGRQCRQSTISIDLPSPLPFLFPSK